VELGEVEAALHESKRLGLRHAGEIADRESKRLGLGAGYCRRYLEHVICYDLGPRELAGLRRFADLAAEVGLAPAGTSTCHPERSLRSEGSQVSATAS
jgi:chorismate dehydratase